MEQKKTADHPASDRPRSPATEARIKEKNRRILMTVSLFVFLAAGNFLMRENDRWKLRETTVIPTAVIVEGKTTDQAQSDKEDTSPLSVEEKDFCRTVKISVKLSGSSCFSEEFPYWSDRISLYTGG